jgi:hypothetical protein
MPSPFARQPHDPTGHFRLWFYAAVLALRDTLPASARELPFLQSYDDELAEAPVRDLDGWIDALLEWERETDAWLPLRDLRTSGALEPRTVALLMLAGLPDEDPGFGALFETVLGRQSVTVGFAQRALGADAVRAGVARLRELGALRVADAAGSRPGWDLAVTPTVWDAVRGDAPDLVASRWRPVDELPELGTLILPPALATDAARIPDVVRDGGSVIVRGPTGGGRRTLARAIARALGRGTLELNGPELAAGVLATLLHAMPVDVLEPAPGETVPVTALSGYDGPRGVVLGRQGGAGGSLDGAIELVLGIPGLEERRIHWAAALESQPPDEVVDQYRMTGGHIRRTAAIAAARAALGRRTEPDADDIRLAARVLHGQLLDTLAARLPGAGDWDVLALSAEVERELRLLERRCRAREQLADFGGAALRGQTGPGVRALLTGGSGTGKTLAARVLAGRLGLDAYRLDLATVVDKYLGETEKNLERALGSAEAANALLLIDEGDALLTRRTAVQTANDRYANLETNFLLQRLESFEGILLITSNAPERIDGAFRRRMDVIVDFRTPEAPERLRILALHLPAEHDVSEDLLRTIAVRCALTGGQLRNAVLHAELLALEHDGTIGDHELEAAVRREYRQSGARCPLPAREAAHA